MKENKRMFGVGRGGNPASRNNLTVQPVDHFVLESVEGMAWSVFSGPTTKDAAYRQAQKLNSYYPTGKAPFQSATRAVAMEHDGLGVAQHEARRS